MTSVANAAAALSIRVDATPPIAAPNANKTYVFADGTGASDLRGHVSGAGRQIEAGYYCSLIIASSLISFLSENALVSRAAAGVGVR